MKTVRLIVSALAACALLFGGCATSAPVATKRFDLPPLRAGTLARLAVDGPNAFINGKRARHGSYVYDGDTVSTGRRTSANLILNDGGYVQLDEDTDPEFRLLRQGACVLMAIIRGQAAVFTNGQCVEFKNERLNTAGVAHSLVNIKVLEQEARITVIEGDVDMRRPREVALDRYSQYTATSEGASEVRQLSAADAAATAAWTQSYFRPAPAQRPGVSPTGALALGALIGGIISATQGDRAPPSRQGGAPDTPPPVRGWCCLPAGDSFASNPSACARRKGSFHPGATSANVCRAPAPYVR